MKKPSSKRAAELMRYWALKFRKSGLKVDLDIAIAMRNSIPVWRKHES